MSLSESVRRIGVEPLHKPPIALTSTLTEVGVRDPDVLAAALLHDTIEDTETSYDDIRGTFGKPIADLVAEVTDAKFLEKASRKRIQVSRLVIRAIRQS